MSASHGSIWNDERFEKGSGRCSNTLGEFDYGGEDCELGSGSGGCHFRSVGSMKRD